MNTPAKVLWATVLDDGCVEFDVLISVYPMEAISKAAHEFTNRAYVLIRMIDVETVRISLKPTNTLNDITKLVGEFSNALLDHKLRVEIGHETRAIRELLVAQAFVEADLLDREDSHASLDEDPRQLRRTR